MAPNDPSGYHPSWRPWNPLPGTHRPNAAVVSRKPPANAGFEITVSALAARVRAISGREVPKIAPPAPPGRAVEGEVRWTTRPTVPAPFPATHSAAPLRAGDGVAKEPTKTEKIGSAVGDLTHSWPQAVDVYDVAGRTLPPSPVGGCRSRPACLSRVTVPLRAGRGRGRSRGPRARLTAGDTCRLPCGQVLAGRPRSDRWSGCSTVAQHEVRSPVPKPVIVRGVTKWVGTSRGGGRPTTHRVAAEIRLFDPDTRTRSWQEA